MRAISVGVKPIVLVTMVMVLAFAVACGGSSGDTSTTATTTTTDADPTAARSTCGSSDGRGHLRRAGAAICAMPVGDSPTVPGKVQAKITRFQPESQEHNTPGRWVRPPTPRTTRCMSTSLAWTR